MNQVTGVILIAIAIAAVCYSGIQNQMRVDSLEQKLEQQERDFIQYRLGVRDSN